MNIQPTSNSILDILKSINSAEEGDIAYITAATLNLYTETNRRLFGRVILTPGDAKAIMTILDILLTEQRIEQSFKPSRITPTEAEANALLQGVADRMKEPVSGEIKDRRI